MTNDNPSATAKKNNMGKYSSMFILLLIDGTLAGFGAVVYAPTAPLMMNLCPLLR
ncbi:MAG: hypothetical protein WAX89_05210 [Alphaproteobacteria bacterium]